VYRLNSSLSFLFPSSTWNSAKDLRLVRLFYFVHLLRADWVVLGRAARNLSTVFATDS